MRKRLALCCVILLIAWPLVQAETPRYKVKVEIDKHANFSRFKTYTWEPGWDAFDKNINDYIHTAIERELRVRGLTEGRPNASDVTVTYATLRWTDTDLDAKRTPAGLKPSFPVAALLVLIRDPRTHAELFRARSDTAVDLDPKTFQTTIDHQVSQIFAKYPVREMAKR